MEGPEIEKEQSDLLEVSKKLVEFSRQITELGNIHDEDLMNFGRNFDLEPDLKTLIRKIGMIYEGQKEREGGEEGGN